MLALSIRQPYAELILRGEKRIEYRSRPTKIIGQRFYIYAAKTWALGTRHQAFAEAAGLLPLVPDAQCLMPPLPTGVVVGSAVIADCVRSNGHFEWHLKEVKRYKRPRKPTGRPQPVWFRPFE